MAEDISFSAPIRISTRKSIALLGVLGLSPGGSLSRERLASLLWGSRGEVHARQSLRQALLSLRKELPDPSVLQADASIVRLDLDAVWVDALELAASASHADPDKVAAACGLLHGELLAGLSVEETEFEEWLQHERARFARLGCKALERYAQIAHARGDGPEAVRAVDRLVEADSLREDWHRLALNIYACHLGQQEALALGRKFKAIILDELGEDQEPETQALIADIRDRPAARTSFGPAPLRAASAEPSPPPNPPPLADADIAPPASKARRWALPQVDTLVRLSLLASVALFVAVSTWATYALLLAPPDSKLARQGSSNPAPPGLHRLEAGTVTLVVMPLSAHGEGGDRLTAIADMITDELTAVLSTNSSIRVISRDTASSYRGQRVDAVAVARELRTHYLLEGSVTASGSRLRLSVGLVDAATGLRVWSQRFEREGPIQPSLYDELINSLGRQLHLELNILESARTDGNPDIHREIRRGWVLLQSAGERGEAALQEAKAVFDDILTRTPNNVHALLGLSWYHANMAVQLFAADASPHVEQSRRLAMEVLARDPRSAGAYVTLGLLEISQGRMSPAAAAFKQAIELNPSNAGAHAQYGRTLLRIGSSDEALEHIHYAMRLSPRDPHLSYWLGFAASAELERRRLAEAKQMLDRALALNPQQPRNRLLMVAVLALMGDLDKARATLQSTRARLPHLTEAAIRKRFSGPIGSEYRRGLEMVLTAMESDPRTKAGLGPRPN